MTVTPAARAKLEEILADRHSVRLEASKKGCSGTTLELRHVEGPGRLDEVVPVSEHCALVLAPEAPFACLGATIGWEDTAVAAQSTFDLPRARGKCGCGESFVLT